MANVKNMAKLAKMGETLESMENGLNNSIQNMKNQMTRVRQSFEEIRDNQDLYSEEDLEIAREIYNSTLDTLQSELDTYTKL